MRHHAPGLRELLAPAVMIGEQALLGVFELEPDNKAFHQRVKTFAPLTPNLARSVAAGYEARVIFDGRSAADTFLLQTKQRLDSLPLPHKATDDDIEAAARRLAFDNRQTARLFLNDVELAAKLWMRAQELGVIPPNIDSPLVTVEGVIARLTDERWWVRALRVAHARRLEAESIGLGLVHRHAGIYVSDDTIKRRRSQKRRNRHALESMLAVNELGEALSLQELAEASISNPRPFQVWNPSSASLKRALVPGPASVAVVATMPTAHPVTATLAVAVVALALAATVVATQDLVKEMTLAPVEWAQAAIKIIVILVVVTVTMAPVTVVITVVLTMHEKVVSTTALLDVLMSQPLVVVILLHASPPLASLWA